MLALLALGAAAFYCYLFWASKRNPGIRLTDAITGDNGRIASTKLYHFLGFHGTFWALVTLTVVGKATAADWTLFYGACGGLALGNKAAANSAAAKAQPVTQPPAPPA